ncbi:MAG TPA: VCBS repeat-containing protein [Planctomycetota bacterium]|jgi:hypothetical protein|nr:VCBS repeat-containing protein [Planctomycetota bacterium]
MRHPIRPIVLFALAGPLLPAAFAQESAAFFDAPVVVAAQNRRIQTLLDLDGDPYPDAAGIWQSTTNDFRLQTWLNDGAGGFVEGTAIVAGSSAAITVGAIAAGDLNGDGVDDLVFSYSTQGSAPVHFVQAFLADGLGGFQPFLAWTLNESGFVKNLLLEDWTGDGLADLALTTASAAGPYVQIYASQASGAPVPTAGTAPLPPGMSDHILFRAEVNGDVVPDLAVASVGASSTLRLFSVSGAVPTLAQEFLLPGVTDPMPACGDVDGDGDEDLVVFRMTEYQVFRRSGASTFLPEAWTAGGPATNLVDIDGDGDLDGVCCGGGGGGGGGGSTPLPPNTGTSTFRISFNDGTGVFAPAFTRTGLGAEHIAGAADVDLDGDVDLVAGRCVYYSPGAALLGPYPTVGLGIQAIRPVFDADRDGDPDLDFGLASIAGNDGSGTFSVSAPVAPVAPSGTSFAAPGYPGDFDGDGDPDLVVRHLSGTTVLGMRILRNNGGGGFTDGGPAAGAGTDFTIVPGSPFSGGFPEWSIGYSGSFALAVDADGDGDRDLVLRRFVSRVSSVIWWNDGTGFFPSSLVLLDQNVKRVADLNGDGLPDLLLASIPVSAPLEGPFVVRLGLGGGAFDAPSGPIAPALHTGDGIDVVDLDGDGDLDVGVAHAGRTIYLNDGSGGFQQSVSLPAGPSPFTFGYFRAVDLDADGLLDVVAAPHSFGGSFGCDVYRATGPGLSFAPPVPQTVYAASLLDVDGDGDVDSASSDVVRNRRFEGATAGLRLQYGVGLAGSGGMKLTLGETGPFRPGNWGEIRVTGGLGGAPAVLVLGTQPANTPILGGTLLVNPVFAAAFTLGGPPGVPGAGSAFFSWFADPLLAGLTFYKQVGILDPSAPLGIAISNGIQISIGL